MLIASLTAAGAGEEVLRAAAPAARRSWCSRSSPAAARFTRRQRVRPGAAPSSAATRSLSPSPRTCTWSAATPNGLIVANAVGERRRAAAGARLPPGKLLAFYYRWLAVECRRLPLGVIDSDWLGGEQQTVPLPDVYVDLDVTYRRRPGKPRASAAGRCGWCAARGRGACRRWTALARERLRRAGGRRRQRQDHLRQLPDLPAGPAGTRPPPMPAA
jgi:hypothetical protein